MRGIDWLRLATVREVLDGASRDVLPPLFMSIETAPRIPQIWPARLRVILDVWPYLDDEQRERLGNYFLMTWRLRNEPAHAGIGHRLSGRRADRALFPAQRTEAQEQLTKWLLEYRKQ